MGLLWETEGRGNHCDEIIDEEVLFSGLWPAGEYEYIHELTIDDGPSSYKGKLIDVNWSVKAFVNIPWKIDPEASQNIQVFIQESEDDYEDWDDEEVYSEDETEYTPGIVDTRASTRMDGLFKLLILGGIALLFILFACAGLIIIACEIWSTRTTGAIDGFNIVFGILWTLAIGYFIYQVLGNSMAEKKLGEVHFKIDKHFYQAGEDVTANLHFTPPEDVHVDKVRVVLTGTEHATSGSGESAHTHNHRFYEKTLTLLSNKTVSQQQGFKQKIVFTLPEDAPWSFNLRGNDIQWAMHVDILLPDDPDWEYADTIHVLCNAETQKPLALS